MLCLNFQGHNDPVAGPQKPILVSHLQASLGRLTLETGMLRRDERVFYVLEHAYFQAGREDLSCCGGSGELCRSTTPP